MTILAQLGGTRFLAMTGARIISDSETTLTMHLPQAKDGIKTVSIELCPDDTYRMAFRGEGATREIDSGVYNDQLQQIFTERTGLSTTL